MRSDITFQCRKCQEIISMKDCYIPEPNYSFERMSDGDVWHEEYAICQNCEEEHEVEIINGFGGMNVTIDGVEECDINYTYPSYDDENETEWYKKYTAFFQKFIESIEDIKSLKEIKVEENKKNTFYRMLFVQIITALETFLSDAFISTVINNEKLVRKHIENDPFFKQAKIELRNVFNTHENIKTILTINIIRIQII